MLTDNQRAAMMPNPEGTAWFHHLRARYVGAFRTSGRVNQFALEIQQFTVVSGLHAEFAGLVEIGEGSALPLVTEMQGALDLENRELRFQPSSGEDRYAGRFSENGRVLELRGNVSNRETKEMILVHEPTLAELHGE